MDRPDDIPNDIWDDAERVARRMRLTPRRAHIEPLARAIIAERERSAQIADSHSECERDCGDEIAAAIRAGSAATHHEIRDLGEFVAERKGKE